MILRLPFPAPELFPNRKNGTHWGATKAAKDSQRDHAYALTHNAARGWIDPRGNIALSLLYLMPDKRHRDCDNMLAASKALIDGMALALRIDDKRFKPILVDWVLGPKGGGLIAAIGCEIRSGMNLQAMWEDA